MKIKKLYLPLDIMIYIHDYKFRWVYICTTSNFFECYIHTGVRVESYSGYRSDED